MAHPYYALSDPQGNFRLEGVPPGEYTLTLWHELLGTQEESVTVAKGETSEVEVCFDAPEEDEEGGSLIKKKKKQ